MLIHAGLGDSDLDCGELTALLSDRFTCYLPSTCNRGLSGHSDDLGVERHIEDLVAEHVPDARVREVPGAGHSCMPAQPGKIVDELARFLPA